MSDKKISQGDEMNRENSYSAELRANAPTWDLEKQHPFIRGIGDGTLPVEKFKCYMRQDYVFLVEFCRVIALAVAKAGAVDDMGWFAQLLNETLNTEMSLHVGFCADFGITEEELKSTAASPTTRGYTQYLVERGYAGSAGEIAVAILPCSWGYAEIGRTLADNGMPDEQPLYRRWIEMYSSTKFEELAEWLRSYVDRVASQSGPAELRRMEETFRNSSRYEYMFWDAAWRMEDWPV